MKFDSVLFINARVGDRSFGQLLIRPINTFAPNLYFNIRSGSHIISTTTNVTVSLDFFRILLVFTKLDLPVPSVTPKNVDTKMSNFPYLFGF